MGKLLVPDELWALVEPILPKHPRTFHGQVGKPRIDGSRLPLPASSSCSKTGIPWEHFPQEMGCCGMTPEMWRSPGQRVAQRRRVGEAASSAAGQIAWRRPDRLLTRHCRLVFRPCGAWGKKTGPSPVDRRKAGSKHHLVVDAGGIPLANILTGRQHPRRDAIDPAGGCNSADPGQTRQPSAQA